MLPESKTEGELEEREDIVKAVRDMPHGGKAALVLVYKDETGAYLNRVLLAGPDTGTAGDLGVLQAGIAVLQSDMFTD